MSILPKAIYLNVITIKIPKMFFTEIEPKYKIYMEPWKTLNIYIAKVILRKKNKAGGIMVSAFEFCYKAIVIKIVEKP